MGKLAIGTAAIAVVLAIALIGISATGFFGLEEKDSAEKNLVPLKIGVMMPLTGDAAIYGESFETSLELAREEINAKGGILGRRVEFVVEDSKCDAKAGVDAINSLVRLKGVDIVIAAECSGPSLSAAPIAEENKVLYLVCVASNPDIKHAGPHVFRIAPSDNQQGKDIARLAAKEGYKNAAALYMDNAYGEGLGKAFVKEFKESRGRIVIEQRFNQEDKDFRTQLLKIREAEPDMLFIVAYSQSYPLIIKQMHELNIEMQVFAGDTFKDETILEAVGKQAEGIILTGFFESDSEEFLKFKEKYWDKYGKEFGPYGDYAYDSLYVLKEGIEQAGSFDPEVLKETLYGLSFEGATGLTEFDSLGEVDKPFGIMVVKNGKFVEYDKRR